MHPHGVVRVSLLLLTVLAPVGCATAAKAPDDRAQVMAVVLQWKQGLLANDVSRVMPLYSENVTSEFGDRAEITKIMTELAQRMVDEDGRIDIENADLVVDGDKASVKPISIGTRKGAVCRSLYLAKTDGRWLIVELGRK
jgi:ketosteroid isomerase-like protein